MVDLIAPTLHIKEKHNGEIPYRYGVEECARLMKSYAEEYHKSKLNLMGFTEKEICVHPWRTVLGDGEMQPAKCLVCGEYL